MTVSKQEVLEELEKRYERAIGIRHWAIKNAFLEKEYYYLGKAHGIRVAMELVRLMKED